jgi:tRNA modification GTPase
MAGDTIFAPATAPGRAGIAIIRVSGPQAGDALAALGGKAPSQPRIATRARFCDPASGVPLDDGIAIWFPAPASFTGEDVAELHVHGGRATVAAMLAALGRLAGLRLAGPGEFTRRAFDNFKLDLAEVEGLADLVAAETEAQRRQALRQLDGALGRQVEAWRQDIVRLVAWAEADIDFADQDLPAGLATRLDRNIKQLLEGMTQYLVSRAGERLRDGVQIAILGAPNAGKSSLLNALARREAAIVATEAGTTRDVIEVSLDLAGYPAVIADTAGLREASGVEAEGVRRALARAEAADLRLVLFDAAEPPDPAVAAVARPGDLAVFNKIDLPAARPVETLDGMVAFAISIKTGQGMDALLAALTERVAALAGAGDALITRARHREALEDCRCALERARAATAPELAAEDLRLAARSLGRITGRVGVEDVLDVIFREFCIGK